MIIGKLIFTNVLGYYGLELCLKDTKYKIYPITNRLTALGCDILLVSLFYFRDILNMEKFLRDTGLKMRKGKPIIIAGGMQATITPELVAEMVDYVFVGDGEEWLEKILDGLYEKKMPDEICPFIFKKGMPILPEPCEAPIVKPLAYKHSALKKVDGARKRKDGIQQSRMKKCSNLYRIEVARGCRHKCPFCVMSHLKKYREASIEDLKNIINDIPEHSSTSFFAPDRAAHSKWPEISQMIKGRNLVDYGQDVRLEHMEKIDEEHVTIGLEGISYKLRKSIKKNYSEELIFRKFKDFMTTGKRPHWGGKISIYYIADLPGEEEEDWQELYEFFQKLSSENWTRHLILQPVLNPLSPKPYTDLFEAEIHPFRNYEARWQKFCRGGDGNSRWGFKIIEYRTWNCWDRVLDAIIHRGKNKGYKIISLLADKPLIKLIFDWDKAEKSSRQLLKICHDFDLSEETLFGGKT